MSNQAESWGRAGRPVDGTVPSRLLNGTSFRSVCAFGPCGLWSISWRVSAVSLVCLDASGRVWWAVREGLGIWFRDYACIFPVFIHYQLVNTYGTDWRLRDARYTYLITIGGSFRGVYILHPVTGRLGGSAKHAVPSPDAQAAHTC
jgi:hypothetical protein